MAIRAAFRAPGITHSEESAAAAGGELSCSRDDWYGRALSVHTGLGSGTVLQRLYRLENSGWLESRWEDKDAANRDGRPPRRFYRLTGVWQREARALLAERFKGQLRFAPGGGWAE